MPCYHPLRRWWWGETDQDGKQINAKITGWEVDTLFERPVGFGKIRGNWSAEEWSEEIPCGKCIGCRLEYSRQWANRCMLEAQEWPENWFITLTYDDAHLPFKERIDTKTGEMMEEFTPSLYPPDITKFMKDLRRYWEYHYGEQNIRFYACGEYGSHTARPHYHIIAFNLKLHDLQPCGRSKSGKMQWDSPAIRKIWGRGLTALGHVEYDSCAYVARYMLKKQKGENAKEYYAEMGLEPEFTRSSRRPGIAAGYFERNKEKIYHYDEIVLPGNKVVRPPKYYDKLYDIENPKELEEIKNARKAAAKEAEKAELAKTTLTKGELLALKERTAKEKIKKLPRQLEE